MVSGGHPSLELGVGVDDEGIEPAGIAMTARLRRQRALQDRERLPKSEASACSQGDVRPPPQPRSRTSRPSIRSR